MNTKNPYFICATLLNLPLVGIIALFVLGTLLDAIYGDPPDVVAYPIIYAVYWVSQYVEMISLFLCCAAISVVLALIHRPKSKLRTGLIVAYACALAISAAYVIWYHVTGQVFDL